MIICMYTKNRAGMNGASHLFKLLDTWPVISAPYFNFHTNWAKHLVISHSPCMHGAHR